MQDKIADFLRHLKTAKGYSDNTIAAYRNDLTQFMSHRRSHGTTRWEGLSKKDIVAFELHLKERNYADSTVARKVASIRSFCHYLASIGLLPQDPATDLDSPQIERRTPKTLTPEEVRALLELPASLPTAKGLRDRALLELLYATGMRVSELIALNLEHIDLTEGTIQCGCDTPSKRRIRIPRETVETLRNYVEQARPRMADPSCQEALFVNQRGNRLSRQGLWLIVKAYVKRLGLGDDVTPHTLRHTAAAHRLKRGARLKEVQQLLGHSSSSSTQVYARLARLSSNREPSTAPVN